MSSDVTGLNNQTANAIVKAGAKSSSSLGQADFLKLLTTQLKYQDPQKPMEDTAFISQMAQFSALQAQTALNKTITDGQAFSQLTEASALIGKTVHLQTIQKSAKGDEEVVESSGTVQQVSKDKDGVKVLVDNVLYSMGDIVQVNN
ncbi:MAG TPA: flagellar hook assembly protein FlgD [Cyanobacteria bacterium UBA8530]|nr:flagellar hook assembly protein FlgD [Cyanobacteria bacterium UBA8530]